MDMVLKIWNNLCKKYKKEEIKKAEDATDKTNKGGVNPNLQGKPNDIPVKFVLDFLEQEKVTTDREKARNLIRTEVDPSVLTEGKITLDDFSKLFCKGIFKHALMRIAKKVLNQEQPKNAGQPTMTKELAETLDLETKMNTFRRTNMIKGLDN